MADIALGFLEENLKQLLLYNDNLIVEVKHELELMYNELRMFKAFLSDMEHLGKKMVRREMLRQITDGLYEAEDMVDAILVSTKANNSKIGSVLKKVSLGVLGTSSVHPAAQDIGKVRERLTSMYKKSMSLMDGLRLEDAAKKETVLHVEEDKVVGFEDEAKEKIEKLPFFLKACFLYFGMFPKGFEIPVWKLVRLWIAEGFIQQKEKLTLEDIAEEYLNDLVKRDLVIAVDWRSNGKIKTCSVQNALHELCKKEAAEQCFLHEIENPNEHNSNIKIYRRSCIHSNVSVFLSSLPRGRVFRSFLCFSSDDKTVLQTELISSVSAAFELVKVLDAESIIFTSPLTVELVHLKYIALSIDLKILPLPISSLSMIQTLVVETSSPTLEIKGDVSDMIRLRHFKTNVSTTLSVQKHSKSKRKKERFNPLSVQTLSIISPESCTEEFFEWANDLKSLGIRGKLAEFVDSEWFDNCGRLSSLENLKLVNDVFPDHPPSKGKVFVLPPPDKFPPKLKKLTLSKTLLPWKDMYKLEMLANLEILKLKDNAFEGECWETKKGSFRALTVLHVEGSDLVSWKASGHNFPKLRHLYVRRCSKLEALPLGLADVSSLEVVDLKDTNSLAAPSARIIQQKKQQIIQCEPSTAPSTSVGGFKLSIDHSDV